MSRGIRRRVAITACRVLQRVLPRRLRSWGAAVEAELGEIADDRGALWFALGSVAGLMPRALGAHLAHAAQALAANVHPGGTRMRGLATLAWQPRAIGIACAVGAVALGLAALAAAGAPPAFIGINAAALVIGSLLIGILDTVGAGRIRPAQFRPGIVLMALALALLATALLGTRASGAARWVALGGLSIQPSLILLPVMLVAFARARDALSAGAMVVAAAALALQPDRAMAGMLVAAGTALALRRPSRNVLIMLAAGMAGFAVTLARADLLPATPHVDRLLYTSFAVHPLAGIAVLGGTLLLLVPAIVGLRHDAAQRDVHLVFGAAWLSAIAAAALGNYPTPIVGYGGSAIVGYMLSIALLPRVPRAAAAGSPHAPQAGVPPSGRLLRLGLAR